jgi:geranylgeranyl diphosphate synthase type II
VNRATFDLKAHLAGRRAAVDRALDERLPPESGEFARLARACRYSVFAGGKRFRPALVLDCCGTAGGDPAKAMPAACAVEMLHTYSLIHDDLPAMDDDDLRRGKPSCHRAFDEATAILAGDALLALALETACECGLEVARTLARAAGPGCLVGGQMLDMLAERKAATLEEVDAIHDHKTADLIAASCRAGALVACGTEDDAVRTLEHYGRLLGHAFQIADDVLDVTSTPEELGKTPGKDAAKGKATYPALAGIDRAREKARELVDEAVALLGAFGGKAEPLEAVARFVVERES